MTQARDSDDGTTPVRSGAASNGRVGDPDEIEQIAHVGSWTLDPATGEATWSPEMYRILGLDPTGSAIALPAIDQLFTSESVERVTAAIGRALETGEPWHEELELLRPGGGWVMSNGIAERDEAGRIWRIRGTMQDVTEHRRLEEQLRQSQRLEAIGQLAGGIAHDFNNLLTAIRGYAELARSGLEPGHEVAGDLDHVVAAADRARELVGQLLAFSRKQVLEPRVIDPGAAVEGIVPLLRRLLGEGIQLTARSDADLGRITVDPGQLGQVIVNLAVNARDAMPRGGNLVIETTNVELDAAYAANHPDASAGRHVVIAVSDNGHGMDAATRARAFEPFFTTKPAEQGTGMGLATVYGIVHQSGGSIYLYSEPGRGTTFKLYFPRTDQPLTDVATVPAPKRRVTGTETILLVEDDDDVRSFARRVLSGAGFTVLDADRGSTALELAARVRGPIHLLLTDAVMPGFDGLELAERLVAVRPGLRVLCVSGFSEHAVLQHGAATLGMAFLPKPYRAEDLLGRVRAVLDA
ncbi:MAG TPA: ATP-binding protein [Candidatus Limnocylindrales bacterium]|nr:ATP-binding protein [Candidatus Limnocylindrales bacterium]